MIFDKNIDFKYIISNMGVLKVEYTKALHPFLIPKEILAWREWIYGLKLRGFIKDEIWEVLNSDISLEEFCDKHKDVL